MSAAHWNLVPAHNIPVPAMSSHLVCVALTDARRHALWLDGRDAGSGAAPRGSTRVVPAGTEGRVEVDASVQTDNQFEFFHFYVAPNALTSTSSRFDIGRAEAINFKQPEAGVTDAFLEALARRLVGLLDSSATLDRFLVEQISVTALMHMAARYGAIQIPRIVSGALHPKRLRRVMDRIEAELDTELTLANLAAEAGLSERHFCTSFGRSVGMSPHRYLLQRRIARAKVLLATQKQPVIEIALDCGFSSAGHFATAFKQVAGTTPSAYRKSFS